MLHCSPAHLTSVGGIHCHFPSHRDMVMLELYLEAKTNMLPASIWKKHSHILSLSCHMHGWALPSQARPEYISCCMLCGDHRNCIGMQLSQVSEPSSGGRFGSMASQLKTAKVACHALPLSLALLLTCIRVLQHAANAVFMLLELALNRIPFYPYMLGCVIRNSPTTPAVSYGHASAVVHGLQTCVNVQRNTYYMPTFIRHPSNRKGNHRGLSEAAMRTLGCGECAAH